VTEVVSPSGVPCVCALAGCGEPVVQSPGGGRRRLYCSNAHRAEARRRRLADNPEPGPADALGTALDRLAGVLDDLRRHENTVRSIDPARQAFDTARIRAEATAEILSAQQAAAAAAEDASHARDALADERARWDERRGELEAQLEDARRATARARESAASATDALDAAQAAHRRELDDRGVAASRAASAHEADMHSLSGELARVRTVAASAEARAEEADRRAAVVVQAERTAVARVHDVERESARLQVALSKAAGSAEAAAARAEAAEKALDAARVELGVERERRDAAVEQLSEQLATLIAAGQPTRPGTKATAATRAIRTRSGPANAAPPSPTAPGAPDAASRRRRSGGTSK
jgi:chromosome segregation ATPase